MYVRETSFNIISLKHILKLTIAREVYLLTRFPGWILKLKFKELRSELSELKS